jgi:hypothetical protein
MSDGDTLVWASNAAVAVHTDAHQSAGACSAQSVCGAEISISCSGYCAIPMVLPVFASTKATLTEEEPMSYPSRYIFTIFIIGEDKVEKRWVDEIFLSRISRWQVLTQQIMAGNNLV